MIRLCVLQGPLLSKSSERMFPNGIDRLMRLDEVLNVVGVQWIEDSPMGTGGAVSAPAPPRRTCCGLAHVRGHSVADGGGFKEFMTAQPWNGHGVRRATYSGTRGARVISRVICQQKEPRSFRA
jgi:hypothetical protein